MTNEVMTILEIGFFHFLHIRNDEAIFFKKEPSLCIITQRYAVESHLVIEVYLRFLVIFRHKICHILKTKWQR